MLTLELLLEFKFYHPQISVKAILGDALYNTGHFMNQASEIFGSIQTISQLQKTQVVRFRNKEMSLDKYFNTYPGREKNSSKGSVGLLMSCLVVHY